MNTMRQGEIWLVSLDPTTGSEIRKTRPAVIVSSDLVGILPLKLIVPFTEWKDRYAQAPWMVKIEPDDQNYLSKLSAVNALQIRSISKQRLVQMVGTLSPVQVSNIVQAIMTVLQR
jgi:mRNA interferase MazF